MFKEKIITWEPFTPTISIYIVQLYVVYNFILENRDAMVKNGNVTTNKPNTLCIWERLINNEDTLVVSNFFSTFYNIKKDTDTFSRTSKLL